MDLASKKNAADVPPPPEGSAERQSSNNGELQRQLHSLDAGSAGTRKFKKWLEFYEITVLRMDNKSGDSAFEMGPTLRFHLKHTFGKVDFLKHACVAFWKQEDELKRNYEDSGC